MPARRLLIGDEAEVVAAYAAIEGREHEVAVAYEAGATVRDLVDRFGANQRTIRKALQDEGVEMRPPGRKPA